MFVSLVAFVTDQASGSVNVCLSSVPPLAFFIAFLPVNSSLLLAFGHWARLVWPSFLCGVWRLLNRTAHNFGFTSYMTDSLLPVVVGLITAQNVLGTIFFLVHILSFFCYFLFKWFLFANEHIRPIT